MKERFREKRWKKLRMEGWGWGGVNEERMERKGRRRGVKRLKWGELKGRWL